MSPKLTTLSAEVHRKGQFVQITMKVTVYKAAEYTIYTHFFCSIVVCVCINFFTHHTLTKQIRLQGQSENIPGSQNQKAELLNNAMRAGLQHANWTA
jgi:hypothetical protein